MKIYFEGGDPAGRNKDTSVRAQRAFSVLAAHVAAGRMPRFVACGSRRSAYEQFVAATRRGERAALLIDSEEPVTGADAWAHVATRKDDEMPRPQQAADHDLQLMATCTEAWALADTDAAATVFGEHVRVTAKWTNLEVRDRRDLAKLLGSKPKVFDALARTRVEELRTRCPAWGARFIAFLTRL